MSALSRRAFFGGSLAALALPSTRIFSADPLAKPEVLLPPKLADEIAFEPNTLHLTWFRDPTTTMVVQWIGTRGETSDTNVYFSPSGAGIVGAATGAGPASVFNLWRYQTTETKHYGQSDLKVFRAELTGLLPNTEYQFRIGRASPVYKFRTMPTKSTNAIQFITGGDCGINSHAVANNIQAARQDPMFAVVGGDLGYDNGKSIETSLAFIRNYSRTMIGRGGRLIPLLACIGNHEVDGGYDKNREKAPFFYALFDGLFTDTGYASLDFGDYLSLILLDTGHTSPIGGAQTDWLEKSLKERKDREHVMVVNHVPAYPSYRTATSSTGKPGTGADNRKYWVPLFEQYRVPVVLEHHDHTFKRTKPLIDGLADDTGVLYLGDGSWGRIRPPQSPEKLSVMAATSMDYHLTMHRLQGAERYHLALDENGRIMDVSRTGQRTIGLIRAGR